jgi:hypothetical protein
MRTIQSILLAIMISSCTLSVNMVHTEGEASDVVDETQSNEPNVSPDISVPVGAI